MFRRRCRSRADMFGQAYDVGRAPARRSRCRRPPSPRSAVASWSIATSSPSRVAPSRIRCTVLGRWPTPVNICGRVEHHLDRPADHPCRERGEDDVRPHAQPGAEAAAEIGRVHPHRGLRDARTLAATDGADVGGALRGVVHGRPCRRPRRRRSRTARAGCWCSPRSCRSARGRRRRRRAPASTSPRRMSTPNGSCRSSPRASSSVEQRARRARRSTLDQPRRVGRLLRRVRDHDRDVLAVVQDAVVLQRRRAAAGRARSAAARPSLGAFSWVMTVEHARERPRRVGGVDVA